MSTPVEYYLEPFAYDLPEIQPLKSDIDKEKLDLKTKEKTGFQIICIVTGSLTTFTCGMLMAWPSPFMLKIVEDKTNYDITEEQASLFTTLNIVGIVILTPMFIPLVQRIGAKSALILAAFPYVITWLLKAFVTNLYGLYLARFLAGCGDALTMPCLPVYIGEISTPKVRGLWGNAFICSLFTGLFTINVIGAYLPINITSFIGIIFPIVFLIIFPFLPESPYFCIAKGRTEDAMKNLQRLRRRNDVEEEFKQIEVAVNRQLSESGSWREFFTIQSNRRALLAGLFLRNSQLFGGIMTFAAYTQFIFQKSGSTLDPKMSSILYTAISCSSHTLASLGSSRLGRRKSFMISVFLCGIILTFEGFYFLLDTNFPNISLKSIQWFPLGGMLLYIIFCSFGLGTVPPLMLSELFSASIKTKAVAVVTSTFGITGILVNNMFYYLNSYTGLCGPFFMFAGFNFVATVVTYFIVPETKGKTLEEIQQVLKKK